MVTKVILLYTLSKRHFPHAEIVSDNATHVSFLFTTISIILLKDWTYTGLVGI